VNLIHMTICIQGDLSFWNKKRIFYGILPIGAYPAAPDAPLAVAKRPRPSSPDAPAAPPSPAAELVNAAPATLAASAAPIAPATVAAVAVPAAPPDGPQVGTVHRVKPDGGA
jgi:hypothetical protein